MVSLVIRLRYTGLLVFASSVFSLFTGLVFSSFIARALSKYDYGVWTFISSMIAYFQFSQGLLTSWAFRDIARGRRVEKTYVASELLLSIPSFVVCLIVAPFFSQIIGSSPSFFYLSSLLIPAYFLADGLSTVLGARSPHKLAYRNIILDSMKILLILWLIQFGLFGFIATILMAYCGYICYCLYALKDFLRDKFDFKSLKRWLSFSWIDLYSNVGSTISSGLAVSLVALFTSPSILGSWGIVLAIARFLKMTSDLPSALYPKLLVGGEKKEDYVKDATMLLLMFLIPMAVGCYLLAPNLIDIFGSKYLDGLPALYILIPSYFTITLSAMLEYVILADEKIDLEEKVSFSRLIRSNVFFLSSLSYLNVIVSLPLMFLLIPRYSVTGCAMVILTMTVILFLIRSWKFNILKLVSYRRLAKYLCASFIMSIFVYFFYGVGTIRTLLIIVLGVVVYFAALFALDKKMRELANGILSEIKSVTKRIISYLTRVRLI